MMYPLQLCTLALHRNGVICQNPDLSDQCNIFHNTFWEVITHPYPDLQHCRLYRQGLS